MERILAREQPQLRLWLWLWLRFDQVLLMMLMLMLMLLMMMMLMMMLLLMLTAGGVESLMRQVRSWQVVTLRRWSHPASGAGSTTVLIEPGPRRRTVCLRWNGASGG